MRLTFFCENIYNGTVNHQGYSLAKWLLLSGCSSGQFLRPCLALKEHFVYVIKSWRGDYLDSVILDCIYCGDPWGQISRVLGLLM